jgi:hypothetical protein
MAIVGHPFYAGGHDVTLDDEPFTHLKKLLLRHDARIMMAGDTHDFEYYAEPGATVSTTVHYFVNGGGGAYLSFGTALAWPARPPTVDWAHYPTLNDVSQKIDAMTPWWEASRLVVDAAVRCLAVLGGMAVGGVRLQRRAVLSELRRGPCRAIGQPCAVDPLWRSRPPDNGRRRAIRKSPDDGDTDRMGDSDGGSKFARRVTLALEGATLRQEVEENRDHRIHQNQLSPLVPIRSPVACDDGADEDA